jgi:hypothetical protein
MKWFQHQSDSHMDLDLQTIREEFGCEGYGFYWICGELVAHQGKNYRIKSQKDWKKALKNISRLTEKKQKIFLDRFSTLDLINKKSYEQGDLYMPKMKRYSDDYTKRSRRMFGQGSDNVRQDKSRVDKNRIEEKRIDTTPLLNKFKMTNDD